MDLMGFMAYFEDEDPGVLVFKLFGAASGLGGLLIMIYSAGKLLGWF
jgi:hypothetical protein